MTAILQGQQKLHCNWSEFCWIMKFLARKLSGRVLPTAVMETLLAVGPANTASSSPLERIRRLRAEIFNIFTV